MSIDGRGVYANPTTSDWDDTIVIDEYFVHQYDKDNLRPTRFKPFNMASYDQEWKEYEDGNIDYSKIKNDILKEHIEYYDHGNNDIHYFPTIEEDIDKWSILDHFDNSTRTYDVISLIYGNPLLEKPKFKITFEKDGWYKDSRYELIDTDNIPDEWKNIYEDFPSFKDYENVISFLKWPAMIASKPELLDYFKVEKLENMQNEILVVTSKDFNMNREKEEEILGYKYGFSIPYTDDYFSLDNCGVNVVNGKRVLGVWEASDTEFKSFDEIIKEKEEMPSKNKNSFKESLKVTSNNEPIKIRATKNENRDVKEKEGMCIDD